MNVDTENPPANTQIEKPEVNTVPIVDLAKNLTERALLIRVHIRSFSGNKKDRIVSDEVANDKLADKNSVRVWKSLLKSKELSKIKNLEQQIRQTLYKVSALWDENYRIIPVGKIIEVKTQLEDKIRKFEIAVNEAVEEYENMVEADKGKLGSMFDSLQYPSKEAFKSSFSAEVLIDKVPANDYRSGVLSNDEVNNINEQIKNRIEESVKQANADILRRIKERLGKLIERLADTKGKFHESAVTNVIDAINEAKSLNITDSAELENIFNELYADIGQINSENVRKSSQARDEAYEKAFEAVNKITDIMEGF